MRCLICNQAETLQGRTSVLLERNEQSLTFYNVPAHICPQCGESYADEAVTVHLLHQAEKMASAGSKVETVEYPQISDMPATYHERNLNWQK